MQDLKNEILASASIIGVNIREDQIEILDHGVPHVKPSATLQKDNYAIYLFFHEEKSLKIGKCGPKSKARFVYQHYGKSARSTLFRSLEADHYYSNLIGEDNIELWMLNNLRRISIIIDQKLGIYFVNYVEALLHLKYQPLFEGYKSQRVREVETFN